MTDQELIKQLQTEIANLKYELELNTRDMETAKLAVANLYIDRLSSNKRHAAQIEDTHSVLDEIRQENRQLLEKTKEFKFLVSKLLDYDECDIDNDLAHVPMDLLTEFAKFLESIR